MNITYMNSSNVPQLNHSFKIKLNNTVYYIQLKTFNILILFSVVLLFMNTSYPAYIPEMEEPIVKEKVEEVLNSKESFTVYSTRLAFNYKVFHKVNRLDELSVEELKSYTEEVEIAFLDMFADDYPDHVKEFFRDTTKIHIIQTALIDQVKYHIPASIKIAQACLETGYGKSVVGNNYFGIKSKTPTKYTVTTEFLTYKEMKRLGSKVISKQKVGSKYKCIIKDTFTEYPTPWHSFREHSIFISTSPRYLPLFTKGKNYSQWADNIAKLGYATDPDYANKIKNIIQTYNLHLLDK